MYIHLWYYYLLSYFVHCTLIMVQNCCVADCKNVWKRNSRIAYHTFPLKDKIRFAQWMQIDELKDINVTAGKRICSVHFTSESFEEHCSVKRLKRNAVPSLFGENVQVIDDSPVEIIEIWEEICTDSISEEAIAEVPEVKQNVEQEEGQEIEEGKQEVEEEKEQEVEEEIEQVEEEREQKIAEEIEKEEQEVVYETEEISQSSIEHDLPIANAVETKDASVQTISVYYEYREEIWDLRKKLSMLRRQLKQREASISNTRKYIHLLTNSKTSKSITVPPTCK